MEQTVESPVPICPPHHWIITERQSTSLQDWTCQRCGCHARTSSQRCPGRSIPVASAARSKLAC